MGGGGPQWPEISFCWLSIWGGGEKSWRKMISSAKSASLLPRVPELNLEEEKCKDLSLT